MANMTPNMETRAQREPSSGGQQSGNAPQSSVGRAASTAAGLASKQVEKTRDRFEQRLSEQRAQVSGRVRSLGRALRGAGEMLEEDDLAAQALHYASEKIDGVAGYMAELNPTRVAEDLRGVAHTRPVWFFGGAFVLGLALGRFARSTGAGMDNAGSALNRGRGESATRGYGEQPQRSQIPAYRAGLERP